MQPLMRLQQLGDFYHCAVNDRIGDGGAEEGASNSRASLKLSGRWPRVCGKARSALVEGAKAAGEQAMLVPILRRARPRSGRFGQVVALQYVNLVKGFGQGAGGRKSANSGANDNRSAAQLVGSAALLVV
jgi:hypothetical protein